MLSSPNPSFRARIAPRPFRATVPLLRALPLPKEAKLEKTP
jgi:hypothetical protein